VSLHDVSLVILPRRRLLRAPTASLGPASDRRLRSRRLCPRRFSDRCPYALKPRRSLAAHHRHHLARPPWATGCYSLRYRFANNGNNHGEVQIEWFLDEEQLDTKHYGSEIYDNDGTVIKDGLQPIPLAMGQHCCVGGNNRLRARISHTGSRVGGRRGLDRCHPWSPTRRRSRCQDMPEILNWKWAP
jgi:hypothetical protein